jgi:hypothetical protein
MMMRRKMLDLIVLFASGISIAVVMFIMAGVGDIATGLCIIGGVIVANFLLLFIP